MKLVPLVVWSEKNQLMGVGLIGLTSLMGLASLALKISFKKHEEQNEEKISL